MKRTLFIFFVTLLAIAHGYRTGCTCPNWDGSYPDSSYNPPAPGFQRSTTEDVIKGTNYGKPISYAGKIWLGMVVSTYSSFKEVKDDCPKGYRAPTGNELRNLLNSASASLSGNERNFFVNNFGFSTSNYYISSEKTWPDKNNKKDKDSYKFTALYFQNGATPKIDSADTSSLNAENLKTICVSESSSTEQVSEFIMNQAAPTKINSPYTLKNKDFDIVANVWRVDNQIIGKTPNVDWVPNETGCHVIESFVIVFGTNPGRDCRIIEIPNDSTSGSSSSSGSSGSSGSSASSSSSSSGSSVNTALDLNKITGKIITDKAVQFNNNMHFTASTAPIAPKADGGVYVLFSTKDQMDLFVIALDNNGNQVNSPIALNRKGYPFDITSTPWGFVCLIREKDNWDFLYMIGYYENGSQKFYRTIMNNGPDPKEIKDQIKFYNDDGSQPFGMRAMYKPHNGRLVYLQGRINVVFGHYNYFGPEYGGHQGDTAFNFDEDGKDERLAFSWGTSHSLYQNLVKSENKVIFFHL